MHEVSLDAASRIVRVATLRARAQQMLPGDQLVTTWPLAEGLPWRRRLAAVLHEAGWSVRDGAAPGAFTDEILARDAEHAGLALVRRDGDRVTLQREAVAVPLTAEPLGLGASLRCLALVVRAEALLRDPSPVRVFEHARRVGAKALPRGTRAELRAALALLEPLVPGRRGCLRRVVAETLGDPQAAREPVVLGLTPHSTGHASFVNTTPWAPEHPVAFALTSAAAATSAVPSVPPPPLE